VVFTSAPLCADLKKPIAIIEKEKKEKLVLLTIIGPLSGCQERGFGV
jgi:hypothetical protein